MEHDMYELFDEIEHNDVDAVRRLVGLDGIRLVNARDYDNRTPMHLAALDEHEEILQFLLDQAGTDLSPVDRWGKTPLSQAIEQGQTRAVALIEDAIEISKVLFARQRIASKLHEEWRSTRVQEDGSYAPRKRRTSLVRFSLWSLLLLYHQPSFRVHFLSSFFLLSRLAGCHRHC